MVIMIRMALTVAWTFRGGLCRKQELVRTSWRGSSETDGKAEDRRSQPVIGVLHMLVPWKNMFG